MIFPAYVFVILPNLVGSLPVETPQSPATFELGTVCGRHDYTTKQIKAATITACQRLEAGTTIGSNKYPHEFRNEEGFEFEVKSPVFEFPILEKGIYKGGKPRISECGVVHDAVVLPNDRPRCSDK